MDGTPLLHGQIVLDTLVQACSQDVSVLKPAEKHLKTWEIQRGFYSILSEVFLNHEVAVNVRWLAALLFKNGVDRYWRKNAPNGICEEEKVAIKEKLIAKFDEPSPQIATQLAVLIGKIARIDCPRYWTQVVPTLLQAVHSTDDLTQQRSILTLYHVTKNLASKCLPKDRSLFTEMTNEILGYIIDLWNHHLSLFFKAAIEYSNDNMDKEIERVILISKVIRKQIVHGFKELQSSQIAVKFIASLFEKLSQILAYRQSQWGNNSILTKCEKLILLLTKLILDIIEHHALSYIAYIIPTLNFVLGYTFHAATGSLRFERFTVNCLNMMTNLLRCDNYKPPKGVENTPAHEARRLLDRFFTDNLLSEMCRRLITHYFLLKCDDIINWESDPEGYAQEEIGDSYKYSIRPCTEVLFLALFKIYHPQMSAVLIDLVRELQAPCDPDNMPAMLSKEAVYNAVGLASYFVFDEIDFDSWLNTQLFPELQNQHSNYRIVRRRVIWLIGQWASIRLSPTQYIKLYNAIVPLVSQSEDLIVRLEAATTLKTLVENCDFEIDDFLPYVETFFGLLFQLLKDVTECDSKMSVLTVISSMIERVGSQIVPYTSVLIQYLPTLWQDAHEHNMLRCAIVSTLIYLVQGSGTACVEMFDFIIPVVQMSTDVAESPHVYLLEDGLDLWIATLHNTDSLPLPLLTLFRNMPPLLEMGSETLEVCLNICEAYVMLGGQQFLSTYSELLVSSLTSLITDVKFEGITLILTVVTRVIMLFPVQGTQIFQSLLSDVFITSLDPKNEEPRAIPAYLTLFSRIIVTSQDMFFSLIHSVASRSGVEDNALLGQFLDRVFDRLDSISSSEDRKLVALAVVSLLSRNIPVVLEKFSQIVNLSVEVLHDVNQPTTETGVYVDSLLLIDSDMSSDTNDVTPDEITQHKHRELILRHRDPVYTTELREFVKNQFQMCQSSIGESAFNKLVINTDSEVMNQLKALIT